MILSNMRMVLLLQGELLNYGSILDGLDILIDHGYDHILIHVDNLETIKAFRRIL
ncbi:hypothetical protein Gohar_021606 [Gossypium harknessii]|uniref:Uncharacterized protein n=1 Tax=Gossypium harknessii TaxID=34285 RepID=A0A7J9ICV0_9ROSI|nr:hypothetical protein [Gossypium harknessii]